MKFSVITINLNNRSGLEKTIKSVIGQTNKNYELIIIDGGSTDGSYDVILENKDHFSYWISEPDNGIYHAMNKGVMVARGEFCYFLNSGDYIVNSTLFEDLSKIEITSDILSGNILKIRANGKYRTVIPHDNPSLHKLCIHSLPHQASLIRREIFNEIGMFNETYKIVSDFDFFLRAIIIFRKSYQKVDIDFCYFNLDGISHNKSFFDLAKNESIACLKINFPDMAEDLIEYRYFYISNIGQLIRLIQKKKGLYAFIDQLIGSIFKFKKLLVGR